MRLTLRTLLAYIDDTLPPTEAAIIGSKLGESEQTQSLVEKIRRLTRKRGIATPTGNSDESDPNMVSEYLSDMLPADAVAEFETKCLESEVHLAEAASCHQILTLLLSEPARVPPTARKRMYDLVKGPESIPNRKLNNTIPIGGLPPEVDSLQERDAGLTLGMSSTRENKPFSYIIALCLLGISVLSIWLAWPKLSLNTNHQNNDKTESITEEKTLPKPTEKTDDEKNKPETFVPQSEKEKEK